MTVMQIRDTKTFTPQQVQDLFLSLDWSSGYYPERLVRALQNFGAVYSAWDDDRLVGLAAAIDDGEMTAYVHYVIVRPDCQGRGIGRQLIDRIKHHYRDYLRIVLTAYNDKIPFYERCGFHTEPSETPMFITDMKD